MLPLTVVAALLAITGAQSALRTNVGPPGAVFVTPTAAQVKAKQILGRVIERLSQQPVERGPCGMPIIVAKPEIDRGMIVTIPGTERPAEQPPQTSPSCGLTVVPARR